MPRILSHGPVYFRHVKGERKDEYIAEMVALAWKWHLRLAQRGKDAAQFPTAIATLVGRAVRSGRRLAGMADSKDVLSPRAQQRQGFAVCKLSTLDGSVLDEALHDSPKSLPDQLAMFRLDFPRWLASRTERDRQILHDLMIGERTRDVAARHGLSAGRISQLCREFHDDWELFCAAPPLVV